MSWVLVAVAANKDEDMGEAYVGELKTIILFEKISVCWTGELQQAVLPCAFPAWLWAHSQVIPMSLSGCGRATLKTLECGTVWKLFTCIFTSPYHCCISS